MGRSNLCFKNYIDRYKRDAIGKSINYIDDKLFGVKLKGKAFDTLDKEFNIYLFYNELEAIESFVAKQRQVEYYSSFLPGKKDPHRNLENAYGKYINLAYDENDIIIDASINHGALDGYKEECGYFWIVSNYDASIKEIYKLYRDRDIVEKAIKNTKTGSDLVKSFAQSDEAVEAKTLLGFICAAIRSYVILTMAPYKLQYPSETSQTLIKELDKIQLDKISATYISRYSLTSRQRQILALFGLRRNDIVTAMNTVNQTLKIS